MNFGDLMRMYGSTGQASASSSAPRARGRGARGNHSRASLPGPDPVPDTSLNHSHNNNNNGHVSNESYQDSMHRERSSYGRRGRGGGFRRGRRGGGSDAFGRGFQRTGSRSFERGASGSSRGRGRGRGREDPDLALPWHVAQQLSRAKSLQSDEEVAQYRRERALRWPSKSRVSALAMSAEERRSRGELLNVPSISLSDFHGTRGRALGSKRARGNGSPIQNGGDALLHSLLSSTVRKERQAMLQCVHFLVHAQIIK